MLNAIPEKRSPKVCCIAKASNAATAPVELYSPVIEEPRTYMQQRNADKEKPTEQQAGQVGHAITSWFDTKTNSIKRAKHHAVDNNRASNTRSKIRSLTPTAL